MASITLGPTAGWLAGDTISVYEVDARRARTGSVITTGTVGSNLSTPISALADGKRYVGTNGSVVIQFSTLTGSGSVVVVDAGADLDTARPSGAAVYWRFDAGVNVGASGANVTNLVVGDLIFVADA